MFVPPPSQPRASVWESTQAALLAANLGWTTLCLGGYRADTMVVTSALNVLMLALHFGRRALCSNATAFHPAGWLFVPFLIYAAANVIWVTPVPWLGWQDWLGWAQMVAIFWVVVNEVRTQRTAKFLGVFIVGLATIGVAMACYQRFAKPDWQMLGATQSAQFLSRSSGSFSVPNSFAAMLVLLLPVTAVPIWVRGASAVTRVAFGYLTVVFVFGLGLTLSRGAWLGLAGAIVVWPLVSWRRSWTKRLAVSVGVAAALWVAIAAVYTWVPSARERLEFLKRDTGERSRPVLWRGAWEIFRAQPVFGGGAGSYEIRFERHRPEHEQTRPRWAHNDYLNTLSDYGLFGSGLLFGACAALAWKGRARRKGAQAGNSSPPITATARDGSGWLDSRSVNVALSIGLLAFALHLVVDFHLKIPALAMLVATVAGLLVARVWRGSQRFGHVASRFWPFGGRLAAVSLAIGVLGVGGLWVIPHYRAESLRSAFRQELDRLAADTRSPTARRTILNAAREAFTRTIALDPNNTQAWADRAYVLEILGHDEPERESVLGVAAEADARRAVGQTTDVPEFLLRLGVALDMQGRWDEAGDAFAEALRLAPVSATTWFYYAYHLSLNRVTLPLARAAVATSLRLDPSRPEADSLRRHLAVPR